MLSERLIRSQNTVRETLDPHFSWVVNETAPWSELGKPLAEAQIALVTTCGLYRADVHAPFDAWNDLGDPSFREIHIDTPRDRLRIAHSHYEHRHVLEDLSVALPLDIFQQLEQEGVIGRLHPWVYSFMGYIPEPRQLLRDAAPTVARRLKQDAVDAAFFTPC